MQIDWLTVMAQIANFLLLVWLLKRFLYQPVINAMDQREQRIAGRLQDAERREQSAENKKQGYQERTEALERDRDALMEKAKEAAEAERRELLDEARDEVAEKRTHWQRQVAEEKRDFLRGLKRQAADAIQAIGRRALADLADAELEEQMIRLFIQRLRSMDSDMRHTIAAAAKSVRIATSFKLEPTARGRLTRAIHEYLGEDLEIDYGEAPDLLCGVQLTAAGRRLSWSLADYLQALEERMQAQLETPGGASK